jgi:phage head maturation protease
MGGYVRRARGISRRRKPIRTLAGHDPMPGVGKGEFDDLHGEVDRDGARGRFFDIDYRADGQAQYVPERTRSAAAALSLRKL